MRPVLKGNDYKDKIMEPTIAPVPLEKSYRLINHGPTVLISVRHEGEQNVMAASWVCALDFSPPKLTAVLDKSTMTRKLVEQSGYFVVQVPTAAQLQMTYEVGTRSMTADHDKLQKCGVELFHIGHHNQPFVKGCAGWLLCKVIPEPHNQTAYDLFIGEIIGAWSDTRAFSNGHWNLEQASPEWRSIHYVAGGHFYITGDAQEANTDLKD